jgi:ribonucleoside-diphosphate reductase beta chain
MKGMCQIVTWSIRDETHHVEGMIKLFHQLIKENPEVWTEKFKADIYQTARDMVDLEDRFIDLAFNMGGIRGLKAEDVKKYIRYIADRRLLQLSLKPNYKVKDNPLSWLDWVINGVEHTNFFENRATEYSKGSMTGSLWG